MPKVVDEVPYPGWMEEPTEEDWAAWERGRVRREVESVLAGRSYKKWAEEVNSGSRFELRAQLFLIIALLLLATIFSSSGSILFAVILAIWFFH